MLCCPLFGNLHLKNLTLLSGRVSLVKELIEPLCPCADRANVNPYEPLLLRGGADSEWVPLILSNCWYLQENVVSRFIREVCGSTEHQVSYLCAYMGWDKNSGLYLEKKVDLHTQQKRKY